MRVCVVGLGKLGAPLAAVLADCGHEVAGIDLDPHFVAAIARGDAPVEEPGLQALIHANRHRLTATTDWAAALDGAEASLVIVPTPSGPDGAFVNTHLLAAMESIGRQLAGHRREHLVVVNSTTMPGSMDGPIRERLEAASGRRLGDGLGLCYNPEFIALGSVIHNLRHPDFVLIGQSDEEAGARLEALQRTLCGPTTPVARMNFINAELTKIAVNSYVTMKISFANTLAELCDRLPDADADTVAAGVGRDSRIGGKYLRPALGFAGPCFPRDTMAFAALARRIGVHPDLAVASDAVNQRQIDRLFALTAAGAGPGGRVAVLGLSYKPDTPVIEQSQSVALVQRLLPAGYRVVVHDPAAMPAVRALVGDAVEYAAEPAEAVAMADVVVIATAWDVYRRLVPAAVAAPGRRPLIIDCWRMLDRAAFEAVADIVHIGRHADQPAGRVPTRRDPLALVAAGD